MLHVLKKKLIFPIIFVLYWDFFVWFFTNLFIYIAVLRFVSRRFTPFLSSYLCERALQVHTEVTWESSGSTTGTSTTVVSHRSVVFSVRPVEATLTVFQRNRVSSPFDRRPPYILPGLLLLLGNTLLTHTPTPFGYQKWWCRVGSQNKNTSLLCHITFIGTSTPLY